MPVQPHTHTHIQHTPTLKVIPVLDVYLRNSSDVCVTVFSFQKHSNNKEGKVCHLVHQLLFCFIWVCEWQIICTLVFGGSLAYRGLNSVCRGNSTWFGTWQLSLQLAIKIVLVYMLVIVKRIIEDLTLKRCNIILTHSYFLIIFVLFSWKSTLHIVLNIYLRYKKALLYDHILHI